MTVLIRNLLSDQKGMAAEFALILPTFLLLMLGTIDIGFYAYQVNAAEKATQIGARWAAVTDPVAQELATETYVNQTINGVNIGQGDRLPLADFTIVCTAAGTGCACTGNDCLRGSYTRDGDAFNRLATRIRQIHPAIQDNNIQVEYSGSGLGFAGDPNGPEAAPLITVRLTNMSYRSIILSPLGSSVGLPDFAYSMTAEDGDGTTSN